MGGVACSSDPASGGVVLVAPPSVGGVLVGIQSAECIVAASGSWSGWLFSSIFVMTMCEFKPSDDNAAKVSTVADGLNSQRDYRKPVVARALQELRISVRFHNLRELFLFICIRSSML
jgi:hypothetical protein